MIASPAEVVAGSGAAASERGTGSLAVRSRRYIQVQERVKRYETVAGHAGRLKTEGRVGVGAWRPVGEPKLANGEVGDHRRDGAARVEGMRARVGVRADAV